MQSKLSFVLLFFAIHFVIPDASSQPSTDVYLLSMEEGFPEAPGEVLIQVTDRDGYDNQPVFSANSRLLRYTSMDTTGQTDIYQYVLTNNKGLRLTYTDESEYSATPQPGTLAYSVIRVEMDGTQRLWKFEKPGLPPELLLEDVKPVGYHAWVDSSRVALFVLGDPPTLQLADITTGKAEQVALNIGRSLHRIPGTKKISFVHKETDTDWMIKEYDPETGGIFPIIGTFPGREDYAWHPDGSLFMANGTTLYRWTSESNTWDPVYDFADNGLGELTRIAISPDGNYMAFVANR